MTRGYWQVQELDGSSFPSGDCLTKDEAQHVAFNLCRDFQRGFRVKFIQGVRVSETPRRRGEGK